MPIKLELKLNILDAKNVKDIAVKKSGLKKENVKYFKILKRSLDARDKGNIKYLFTVELGIETPVEPILKKESFNYPKRPVAIIGFGPSGMFAALDLARKGFKIVVIERGLDVDNRRKKIDEFIATKKLDENSNVQFGEGGAGTFSDGKLNTGVKSEFKEFILNEFIKHGAPEEIAYDNKPHIGSDNLPKIVKNIREEIISLGGKFYFNTVFTGLNKEDGEIKSINLKSDDKEFRLDVSAVLLAIGHSARDTFKTLYDNGVTMEKKDCAVGFRIEHLQSEINYSQYGNFATLLPPADYKLVSHASNRSVFTFCMCPGGVVMPAASETGGVVTNGMSNYLRDGVNSNSAIVVQVKKEDYGESVLSGIDYLRSFEKKAFILGGGDYTAPCQKLSDFLKNKPSTDLGRVKPTYPLGVRLTDLNGIYPKEYTEALKQGILDMNKRLKGFSDGDALLTGVETRTSSPVRIIRSDNGATPNINNLYPTGETGYAGGIMSAAIDGLKQSNNISNRYKG